MKLLVFPEVNSYHLLGTYTGPGIVSGTFQKLAPLMLTVTP